MTMLPRTGSAKRLAGKIDVKKSMPLPSAEPNLAVEHQKISGLAVNTLARKIV
jgi:hypothetical protein